MKVLVAGFTSNYGGVESFVINYYRNIRLYDKSFVIDLLCTTENPAYQDVIEQYGGKVWVIPSYKHVIASKVALKRILKNESYDILWCNKCALANIDALIYGKKYGIPIRILHSHNSANMHVGWNRLLVSIFHTINRYRVSAYVTDYWACSEYAAKWMFKKKIASNGQYKYIHNAIEARKFEYNKETRELYREKLGVTDRFVVGAVGRLSMQKNPEFIIRIFNEIAQINKNSILLMVGIGELEQELKEFVNKLGIYDKVRFMGRREDIPELMQAMDCLLLPSRFEGLPIVAVEAQAAGLPVFAAKEGISSKTKICDCFHFLSLGQAPEEWATIILNKRQDHKEEYQNITSAGFNIKTESLKLLNYMNELVQNRKLR